MKYYKELLTIGIPSYNEGKYIRQAIESCIDQACCVIVSDNASTDDTQKICEELSQKYPNLQYVRQEKNLGGSKNFETCFKLSKTKYFMWMGGHDYIDRNYTVHMLHMLENSDAVGCWPASKSVDADGEQIGIYDCWFSNRLVSDNPAERVYALIAHLHDCVGLFGIYRSSAVEIAQGLGHYIIGGDHVFLCEIARLGRIIYSSRSIYNWRQTKFGISDEAAREVWAKSLGNSEHKTENSRQEMVNRQLNALKKCELRSGIFGLALKLKLISKAKRKLQKRFGA